MDNWLKQEQKYDNELINEMNENANEQMMGHLMTLKDLTFAQQKQEALRAKKLGMISEIPQVFR